MENKRLKAYMRKHFDFSGLKQVGVFEGIKSTDYQKQAERICQFFELKNIYDYSRIKVKDTFADDIIEAII